MPTLTTLATGLAGAVGCDFRVAHNQLIFVEFGGKLSQVGLLPGAPAYTVLGTGYTNPEDVKLSADGAHAYVVERSGDLVKVALTSANRSAATVVATGMSQPQQMFLDEAHNAAYVVEFGAPGRLWRINLGTGVKTALFTGLTNGVGLVLTADLQFAYVTEQTTGPDLGRVSRIQLSSAARTTIVHGLTAPFFLAWTDAGESALYCPQRDPANSLLSVNVLLRTTTVVAGALPVRPTAVALVGGGRLALTYDGLVQEITFLPSTATGPVLMGIGFVPFDRITQLPPGPLVGTADTSVDPGYFFQVKHAPFGGTLPVMINQQTAHTAGAAFYQVKIDGVPHTDVWSDYKFVGAGNVLQTITPATVGGQPGCYPVRPPAEVLLWMNPTLGDLLSTTGLTNGLHTLTIQLLNGAGAPISASAPLKLLINNQNAVASLGLPMLGAITADGCGVIHYGSPANPTAISIAFTASHPASFADFSFSIVRGVTPIALPAPPPASGPVTAAISPMTAHVAVLLGGCPTAGYAVSLYVAVTMTNGWGRQSQYDAQSLLAFVLTA